MRERAELIGGNLQIQSAPGKGSAVTLQLPIEGSTSPTYGERGRSLGRQD
jgi:nitrate/nitrite-specific signal transduction histidine kinase